MRSRLPILALPAHASIRNRQKEPRDCAARGFAEIASRLWPGSGSPAALQMFSFASAAPLVEPRGIEPLTS